MANHTLRRVVTYSAAAAVGASLLVPALAPAAEATSQTSSTSAFSLTQLSVLDSGSGEAGSEIAAYDSVTQQVITTNGALTTADVYTIADPARPARVARLDLSSYGSDVTSVAAKGGLAVVAMPKATTYDQTTGAPTPQKGVVVVVDLRTRAVVDTETVGFLPDAVTFTPDGAKVIVANEGQPECAVDVTGTQVNESTDAALLVDPVGSVSILDVSTPSATTSTEVGFGSVRASAMRLRGVIIRAGATAAQDFEPEYPTVSADGTTAYVSLQENNAIAIINHRERDGRRAVHYRDRSEADGSPPHRDLRGRGRAQ